MDGARIFGFIDGALRSPMRLWAWLDESGSVTGHDLDSIPHSEDGNMNPIECP